MRVVAGTLAGVLLLAGCASFRHQHPRAAGAIGGAITVSVAYGGMQAIEKDETARHFLVGAVAGAIVGYVAGYEFERSRVVGHDPREPARELPPPTYYDEPYDHPPPPADVEIAPPLQPPIDPSPSQPASTSRYHELTYELTSPDRADAGVSGDWFGRGGHGEGDTVAHACAVALVDAVDALRDVCASDLPYAGVGAHTIDRSTCVCIATDGEPIECDVIVEATCALADAPLVLGVGSSDSRTVASADAIADVRARCITLGGDTGDLDTSCHCDPIDLGCTCLAQASCDP